MAALPVANPTLLDLARRTDPNGQIATIIELMTPISEILDDMTWIEGNLPTGHKTTVRTGLPVPVWRSLNQFVAPTKSTTTQVMDNTGMLEDWAEVDVAMAELNGNTAEFRLSEEVAHLSGLNAAMAATIFYGNEGTNNAQFTGLSPRFNSLSAANSENIISAGGSANNQSIWLTYWSPNTVCGIIPKGSQAGIQRQDLGKQVVQDVTDGSSGRMMAYRSHYRWDAGLSVRDWRSVVRICNIDITLLTKAAATGPDLPDLLFQAMETVPAAVSNGARPAIYMSRTVMSYLRRQLANKTSGSTLEIADVGGRKVLMFQGVPLRRVDALAASETTVV